ncbi:MAG: hypothetical protein QM658_03160 [Gordonia sp. (in: high G+C Gram-positive bacteria)]
MTAPTVPADWSAACTLGVLRALEAAGKRGRLPRSTIGRLRAEGVPAWEVHLHVRLAARSADCGRLLNGVWDLLAAVLPNTPEAVRAVEACHDYAVLLLVTGTAFNPADFAAYLAGERVPLPA